MRPPDSSERPAIGDQWFATTHWSVVLGVQQGESTEAAQALEHLCRTYWYPLYAYVRRQGRTAHDAQDLTQSFFERLLTREDLRNVSADKGKFRSFLLASLNHFLADQWDHSHRLKRGGGKTFISLDDDSGEERYKLEPVDELSPDKLYERRWALTVLQEVLQKLENEYSLECRHSQFEHLKPFLQGDTGTLSYSDAASKLQMSEGAVRVAVHRMRRRYGELFRREIANTVAKVEEVEEEITHLLTVLGG